MRFDCGITVDAGGALKLAAGRSFRRTGPVDPRRLFAG
jgi:hypothetical protein